MTTRYDEKGNLLLFPIATSDLQEVVSDREWRPHPGPSWPYDWRDPFLSIDFETYFSKKYSLGSRKGQLPNWDYVFHVAFHAYLVSLMLFDGRRFWVWSGRPEDAPFAHGAGLPWVSHNASFDELVYRRLLRDGVVRTPGAAKWLCTADMASYYQLDRGLDRCAPQLIGMSVDKSIRDDMKAGRASASRIRAYADDDAVACAFLLLRWGMRWPEMERVLSILQRRANYEGIYTDLAELRQTVETMRKVKYRAMAQIPWANRLSPTGVKGLNIECAKLGIPPPPSRSLDDPETADWADQFRKQAPWMEHIRTYSKAHQTETTAQMLIDRRRADGTVPINLEYRRAPSTARWQSSGGLRLQNLDRSKFEGVSVRGLLKPRPGHVFVTADLSQIEPRMLHWLVRDMKFLAACRQKDEEGNYLSPYEAHARASMGWTGGNLKKQNPALYQLAKARLLALGYQAWADRFVEMAWTMCQLEIYLDESSYSPDLNDPARGKKPATFFSASQIRDRIDRNDLAGWAVLPPAIEAVTDYRRGSPLVVNYWKSEEEAFGRHVGGDYFMPLENGEVIRYFDITARQVERYGKSVDEYWAWIIRKSRNPKQHRSFHGGKIVENRVQRLSREVLAEKIYIVNQHLRPYVASLRHRWTVHDEIIVECLKQDAESVLQALIQIMRTSPKWAPDLPLDCEGAILEQYDK